MIEIDKNSDAGRSLINACKSASVTRIRIEQCANETIKIKCNEGMWTPPLSTKANPQCDCGMPAGYHLPDCEVISQKEIDRFN